jgi:hypothetical protein
MSINFFNGFWGLLKRTSVRLTQLIPLYILVFIAYGDAFLPQPLSDASHITRTKINNFLRGAFLEDVLENNKYNNTRNEQLIKNTETEYLGGKKN